MISNDVKEWKLTYTNEVYDSYQDYNDINVAVALI